MNAVDSGLYSMGFHHKTCHLPASRSSLPKEKGGYPSQATKKAEVCAKLTDEYSDQGER